MSRSNGLAMSALRSSGRQSHLSGVSLVAYNFLERNTVVGDKLLLLVGESINLRSTGTIDTSTTKKKKECNFALVLHFQKHVCL